MELLAFENVTVRSKAWYSSIVASPLRDSRPAAELYDTAMESESAALSVSPD